MVKVDGNKKQMSEKNSKTDEGQYWDEEARCSKSGHKKRNIIIAVTVGGILAVGISVGVYCGVKFLYLDAKTGADLTTQVPNVDKNLLHEPKKQPKELNDDCLDTTTQKMLGFQAIGIHQNIRRKRTIGFQPNKAQLLSTTKKPCVTKDSVRHSGGLMETVTPISEQDTMPEQGGIIFKLR